MSNERDTIDIRIEPETIGHILKDGRKIFVPVNQRSYRWEDEHVKELCGDLAKAIGDDENEYFLGSIVAVRPPTGRLEINDGQQRLATTMILIAAIRDYFLRKGDKDTATEIERDFLVSPDRRTLQSEPRFHLNNEDHQFFVDNVISRPGNPAAFKSKRNEKPSKRSNQRILAAKQVTAAHVETIAAANPSGAADEMHKWLDFIEKGARVIWVEVSNHRTAYIIFETMNDRGLKLSAADLLKNYIFGQADERKDEAVAKWRTMAGILEAVGEKEDELVEYIRYLWVSKYGHIRSRVLYDSIKEKIKNKTAAMNLMAELENRSRDYVALSNSSSEKWAAYGPNAKKQIDTLNLLGVKQMRPVLLAAQPKFSVKEFIKLLDACIAWSVRCLITGVPSGTVEGYYARIAPLINNGSIKKAKDIAPKMTGLVPNNDRFDAAMKTATVAQSHLARYYLRALQQKEDGDPEPQYALVETDSVNLEHILPENPSASWAHISKEEADGNWRRLGNQALMVASTNSDKNYANLGYKEKKPALKASKYSLTRIAADYEDWDISSISKRQEYLASLALKTWPIDVK